MMQIPECNTSADALTALQQVGCAYLVDARIHEPSDMARAMEGVLGAGTLFPYESDRISPRSRLNDHVYTSTDFSAVADIYFHNECCTAPEWPLYIAFYCRKAADQGGATTVTSVRQITDALPTYIMDKLQRVGVHYTRNLGGDFGNSIDYTFGTTDRSAIKQHCAATGMDCTWLEDNRMRLEFIRAPLVRHPRTGEVLWFNNVAFWHPKSLDRALRLGLRGKMEAELAFSSRLGDKTPIPAEWIDAMLAAYSDARVPFSWREGGMLILDNMLYAHGREKFRGKREVWVTMAQKVHRSTVEVH